MCTFIVIGLLTTVVLMLVAMDRSARGVLVRRRAVRVRRDCVGVLWVRRDRARLNRRGDEDVRVDLLKADLI